VPYTTDPSRKEKHTQDEYVELARETQTQKESSLSPLKPPSFPNLSIVGTMHTSHLKDEKGNHAGVSSTQPNQSPIFARKGKGRNDDKADVPKELDNK
jgi:hypothetical protein